MEEEKEETIILEDECLMFWRDEDSKTLSSWVVIKKIDNNFITFETKQNQITIPNTSVIKIKRKKGERLIEDDD